MVINYMTVQRGRLDCRTLLKRYYAMRATLDPDWDKLMRDAIVGRTSDDLAKLFCLPQGFVKKHLPKGTL
jgi:superfamily I DNA and RNA helicase